MLSSRFTTPQEAKTYLNQHGTKIGKELHLKEGVTTLGEERDKSEFYEKPAVLCSTIGGNLKIINYRVPVTH